MDKMIENRRAARNISREELEYSRINLKERATEEIKHKLIDEIAGSLHEKVELGKVYAIGFTVETQPGERGGERVVGNAYFKEIVE